MFVFLDSAELCLRRITERVAQGGHDVPGEDVRCRFLRAAPVFWQQYRPLAHQSMVVFNGENRSWWSPSRWTTNGWCTTNRYGPLSNLFFPQQGMTNLKKAERWSTSIVRIGNQAVREAQARNRELGIPNWYSLNGRLVSDAGTAPGLSTAVQPKQQKEA
ncbi:hypothetical protein [Azohydromonas australica]|uniref:hypothetical protein n=1 Tax=Azohydromonas australica TaxID=364039 RepID=UPI00041953B8|nr:hypothetical protein [Azohydromonas australica]